MLVLNFGNSITKIDFKTNDKFELKELHQTMRTILSYEVPAAEWSDKYKTGKWDGTISVYDYRNSSFPSGLINHVSSNLNQLKIDYKIIDVRNDVIINANFKTNFNGRKLRDYQDHAPILVKENTRGILQMATGAGKSLAICNTIKELNCQPVLIIVPSVSLLRQTATEINNTVTSNDEKIDCGQIGGNQFIIQPTINVCTYHSALAAYNVKWMESTKKIVVSEEDLNIKIKKSIPQLEIELKQAIASGNDKLSKKIQSQINIKNESLNNKKKLQKLIESCQVFIVDECHIAIEIIEFLSKKADNAYYKIGFTATPWSNSNTEMRLEGALGGLLCQITSSELIKRDILCKPTILMLKHDSKNHCSGYQDCYTKNIIFSENRNNLIADIATLFFEKKLPTVILVERLEHGKILQNLIPNSIFVPGKDKPEEDPTEEERDYRKKMLNKMGRSEIILIGTQWLYTGIDVKSMQCLILAGSCSSDITAYQQVGRVLRQSPETDKTFALVIDFYETDKYLKKHSIARKKTYLREEGYDVRVIK